eukprot:gene9759-11396_t
MSLGTKVQFSETVEVRFFEKQHQTKSRRTVKTELPTLPFKSRSTPFANSHDDSTTSSSSSSSADQQTMDFTATYGKIFVPYVKDEIQPLRGIAKDDEEEEEEEEEEYDDSAVDMSTCSSLACDVEQEEEECGSLYDSLINSPAHKKSRPSLTGDDMPIQQPSLTSLLAEDEDLSAVFVRPATPKRSPSANKRVVTEATNSPIPTLADLYEEDMTGNFKDIIDKFDEAAVEYQAEDTIQFHLDNGTLGNAGRLTGLLEDTADLSYLKSQQSSSSSSSTSSSDMKDMTMTQALGKIIQMAGQANQSPAPPATQFFASTHDESTESDETMKDMTFTQALGTIFIKKEQQDDDEDQEEEEVEAVQPSIKTFEFAEDITNNLNALLMESTPTKTMSPVKSMPAPAAKEASIITTTNNNNNNIITTTNNEAFYKSEMGNNTLAESMSMVTKTQTSGDLVNQMKQYACTPSFSNEGEDSFVYGKINFNRSASTRRAGPPAMGRPQTVSDPILMMEETYGRIGSHMDSSFANGTSSLLSAEDSTMRRPMMEESGLYPSARQSMILEDLLLTVGTHNAPTSITFANFLYLANCRFMDDASTVKSKRASLVGMLMARDHSIGSSLHSALTSAYVARQVNVFRASYEDLKTMISGIDSSNRAQEDQLNKTNPPVFAQIARATKDDLLAKQHMLKKLKNTAKLNTQLAYQSWRTEVERKVTTELTSARDMVAADLLAIGTRVKSLKETEMALLVDSQQLKAAQRDLDTQREAFIQRQADKQKESDSSLVARLEAQTSQRALLASLTHWTVVTMTATILVAHFRNGSSAPRYTLTVRMDPANVGTVTSTKFTINRSLIPKLELELIDKLSISSSLSKLTSLKQVREALRTVSLSISRVQRLCLEIDQLETLYNIRIEPGKCSLAHSSSRFGKMAFDSIGITVQLSYSAPTTKKLILKLELPTNYPNGAFEYSFQALIGKIDSSEITSILTTHGVNSSRRGKLSKTIQHLDSYLSL